MLLIDPAAYREQRILERCFEVGRAHPEALTAHDQSLLNLVLRGGWAELSPIWSTSTPPCARGDGGRARRALHRAEEALVARRRGAERKFRRAYRASLTAHFPDVPTDPDGVAPHRNHGFFRLAPAKHLVSVGNSPATSTVSSRT